MNGKIEGDIALIKLKSPVVLSSTIKLAEYCQKFSVPLNTAVTAVGHGDGQTINHIPYRIVKLKTISNDNCGAYYPNLDLDQSTDMACAEDDHKQTTCNGDIGGALYLRKNETNFAVIAVNSFAEPCRKLYPSIYTNMTFHCN